MIYGKAFKRGNNIAIYTGDNTNMKGKFIRITKSGAIDKRQIKPIANNKNTNWDDLGIRGI